MTPSTANRPAFVDAKFAKGILQPRAFLHLFERRGTYANGTGAWIHGLLRPLRRGPLPAIQDGRHVDIVPKTIAPGKTLGVHWGPIERDATVEQACCEGVPHFDRLADGIGMTQKQWGRCL